VIGLFVDWLMVFFVELFEDRLVNSCVLLLAQTLFCAVCNISAAPVDYGPQFAAANFSIFRG